MQEDFFIMINIEKAHVLRDTTHDEFYQKQDQTVRNKYGFPGSACESSHIGVFGKRLK